MKKSNLALIGLIFVAFVWGSGFAAIKLAFECVGPIYQMVFRFGLAAIILALFFHKELRLIDKTIIKKACILSIPLYFTYLLSSVGIKYTSASKGAFYCCIGVIFVPFFSFLISKTSIKLKSIVSIVCCTIGLFFLSFTESANFSLNIGDILCLMCSVFYALQIVITSKYVVGTNPILLTILEMAAVSLISLLSGIFFEAFPTSLNMISFVAIIYMGVFCTGIAFLIQTVSLKHLSSDKVAIILSAEPVFGAIVSWLLLGDKLGRNGIIGAVFIIGALLYSELNLSMPLKRKEKRE